MYSYTMLVYTYININILIVYNIIYTSHAFDIDDMIISIKSEHVFVKLKIIKFLYITLWRVIICGMCGHKIIVYYIGYKVYSYTRNIMSSYLSHSRIVGRKKLYV